MYAGHLSTALALKASSPRTPTWALVLGVGLIDVVFGVLVLAGVESVTPTPGIAPGFRLDDISWSHSLMATLVWATLFAALFVRHGRRTVMVLWLAAFSHFVLDLVMHPGDLTLWPGSTARLGLGLWARLPVGWWFVELAFVIACAAVYLWAARRDGRRTFGGRATWAVAAVIALHAANSPWTSPLH